MNQKSKKICLAIIPILLAITLICSVVMAFIYKGSQNLYSFLAQAGLIGVWTGGNAVFNKYLKNKTTAIVLAHILFNVLLLAHIIIYQFTVLNSTSSDTSFIAAQILIIAYVFISFIALLVMLYQLFASVIDIKYFRKNISIEPLKRNKLNKILLAFIPSLTIWILIYSLILVYPGLDYITIYNFVGQGLLVGIWYASNLLLSKYMFNKRLAIILSQIIFQTLLCIFLVCSIFFIMPMYDFMKPLSHIYQNGSLVIMSITALVVSKLQLKTLSLVDNEDN